MHVCVRWGPASINSACEVHHQHVLTVLSGPGHVAPQSVRWRKLHANLDAVHMSKQLCSGSFCASAVLRFEVCTGSWRLVCLQLLTNHAARRRTELYILSTQGIRESCGLKIGCRPSCQRSFGSLNADQLYWYDGPLGAGNCTTDMFQVSGRDCDGLLRK